MLKGYLYLEGSFFSLIRYDFQQSNNLIGYPNKELLNQQNLIQLLRLYLIR